MTAASTSTSANKRGQGKKWHWTPDEDQLLTVLIHRYGAGNWDHIASHVKGRSGKSCRVRWINQLNPAINKSPFSEADQQRLLRLHETYGNKWSTIATFFPGRTDNQLKNQYRVLARSLQCMKASPDPPTTPPPLVNDLKGLHHYGSPHPVSQFSYGDFAHVADTVPSFYDPYGLDYPIPFEGNFNPNPIPYHGDHSVMMAANVGSAASPEMTTDVVEDSVQLEHPTINFLGI